MARTFRARYDGRCPLCGKTIHEGDALTWDEERAVHADCIDEQDNRTRPTCPKCWLEISTSGECGCS